MCFCGIAPSKCTHLIGLTLIIPLGVMFVIITRKPPQTGQYLSVPSVVFLGIVDYLETNALSFSLSLSSPPFCECVCGGEKERKNNHVLSEL